LKVLSQLIFLIDGVSHPHRLPAATGISNFTGSDQALDRARAWLNTCILQHICSRATSAKLPTRVLALNGLDQVKLYVSRREIAPYACLSHCWGNDPLSILRTTTITLEAFQTLIPWRDLPGTFRDAINFTYRLGLRYLWIDSLCIVQDSILDWRHEGSLMAEIYESAHVTLAATKASNPTEGCFSTPAEQYLTRSTQSTTEANDEGNRVDCAVHVRSALMHYDSGITMLTRGWVRTTPSRYS
jgi:hypothetical protein